MASLKQNFSYTLLVDELVACANMSPSTSRQHFRAYYRDEPLAVSEAVAAARSTTVDAEPEPRRRECRCANLKPDAEVPGIVGSADFVHTLRTDVKLAQGLLLGPADRI